MFLHNITYLPTVPIYNFQNDLKSGRPDFFIDFFIFLNVPISEKRGEIATDPVWTFNTLILSMKIVFPWP